jgi:site-specific DNA-methyltransferase (adenine-specific)
VRARRPRGVSTFAGSTPATALDPRRQEWETPPDLFELLDREFRFGLDAAASAATAKCARWLGPGSPIGEDAILVPCWQRASAGGGPVWLNPPYGRWTPQFAVRARLEAAECGATVVCLLPARTETAWWQESAAGSEVRLLRGRVRFLLAGAEAEHPAPFASAVVVMRPGDPEPEAGPWQRMLPSTFDGRGGDAC